MSEFVEFVATTKEGFELLCSQAAIIATLPLEEWLAGLERGEALGPIIDPTLYQEYLYSEKAKIIKELITLAIPLKAAVLKAQALVKAGKV